MRLALARDADRGRYFCGCDKKWERTRSRSTVTSKAPRRILSHQSDVKPFSRFLLLLPGDLGWSRSQPAFFSATLSSSLRGMRLSGLGLIARLLSPPTDTGISPSTVVRRTMRRALP
ncbi:hypothetical protein SAMN04244547_04784 [Azotobacter vinelandii]|nr:hypothetical protein SAMN04244547_04784 [Azotobacter vinelandii]